MARRSRKSGSTAPSLQNDGWWDRLPVGSKHLISLLLLLVVAVGFYAPVVLTDRSIVGGDIVNWRAMAEAMIEYEEETGESALWAPNAFAGMPGYMISYRGQIPQVDSIAGLLRGIVWPVSHFIFLLLGTYLLLYYLTKDHLAGVLAAVAYGLTTYLPIILVAGHNSKYAALCFAPWLVLAFAYALRKPGLLASLLFAIALGANIRAGHVQITYYFAFMLGIWWIVELVGSIRSDERKAFAATTGWLVLGSVLGLLLVAQPYLANYEYKAYTIRGAAEGGGGLDWSYAMAWSQGVGEMITLIAADAFGGASPTYWGPKPFTGGPHYVGAVVVLLAVLALWRRRTRFVIGLGIATLLMTLFSLGEYFPLLNRPMYDYFPLFNAFRVPETWLSAVAFALAVLGGVGLYVVRRDGAPDADRAVYAASGGVAGLLLVLLVLGTSIFDFSQPDEAARLTQQIVQQRPDLSAEDPRVQSYVRQTIDELRDERADTYSDELFRSLLFVLLAGAALVVYRTGKLPAWTTQAALVLLVAIDLWGVGRRYLSEEQTVSQDPRSQIATYDFDRFILQRKEEEGGPGHFRVLSLESGNPFTNARPSYHYESLGGYHGAKLRLIQDYIDELFLDPETGAPNENALDILNTRYIVARGRLPGTRVVYQGESTNMLVLENPDAVPRAYFVGETEVIEDRERILERIRSASFDPRRSAILSEPLDFETTPIDSASTASVELVSYSPREIVWNVETDAPRLLVVSEIYYPAGWKATVDGEGVPIHRADYLLRAVPVQQGSHRVTMRFEPAAHRIGYLTSLFATVLVYGATAFLLVTAWRRRRKRERTMTTEQPVHE